MKKVLLLVLDGMGLSDDEKGNALKLASTPVLDDLMTNYPFSSLKLSKEDLNISANNGVSCEVGHELLGTGQIVAKEVNLLDEQIRDKKFFENKDILSTIDYTRDNGAALHLIGTLSSSDFEASLKHYFAVLAMCKSKALSKVYLHFFTDGKDAKQNEDLTLLEDITEKLDRVKIGKVASLCGRYYALDKQGNFDRTKKCYDLLTYGIGNNYSNYYTCLEMHYKNGYTDEYISPSVLTQNAYINSNDSIIFMNYNSSGIKQLFNAFTDQKFDKFRTKDLQNLHILTMSEYSTDYTSICKKDEVINSIGEYFDNLGFRQARVADDNMIDELTYYFDGEKKITSNNYSKYIVPVVDKEQSIIEHPEKNMKDLTQTIFKVMDEDYDFIVASLPNANYLGSTGNFKATSTACELVDYCLGKIIEKANEQFYEVIVTSDHGNVEEMVDETDNTNNMHTFNDVPFVICNKDYKIKEKGSIIDVAPTIVDIFDIKKPDEMTGKSLLEK